MTCINFVPDLYDLGGQHVCWDTDMQCPVQDPTTGGTNLYCGSGNIFQNAQGDTYYRVSTPDGTVYQLNGVTPPSQQQRQPSGNQQQTGRPASPSTNNPQSPNNPAAGGLAPAHTGVSGSQTLVTTTAPGAAAGAAAVGAAGGLGGWLTKTDCLGQAGAGVNMCIPRWVWVGGGLAVLTMVNRGGRRGRLL